MRWLLYLLILLLGSASASAQWITGGGGGGGNFNLGPGFTNAVGTQNTGSQVLSSGQSLFSQLTPVLVTANCTLDLGGASGCQTNAGIDSGALIIPNAASLTITLPLSATSGTKGRVYNLGNGGFAYTVAVAGGSQVIKGCAGSGTNSLSVPINIGAVLVDMGSTAAPSYTCYLIGSTAAGGGITQLTGDVTAGPGTGSQVATLANSGVTAATYNNATVTVDVKGRVTGASSGSATQPPVATNVGTHTVTTTEWNAGTIFVCTASCVLTLPAASGLSATLPGISIQTIGVTATLTATGTDVINNGQVGGGAAAGSVFIPADTLAPVTSSGTAGTTAFSVPLGPVQYFPFTWMPGQNLASATTGVRIGRWATPRILYAIRCENDALVGGTATIDFYSTIASGAVNSGTKLNSSSFNANASNVTDTSVPLTTTPTQIPANYWFGMVAAGAGWSASTGAGGCQATYR